MKLTIIICAYNERTTILEAVQQAEAVDLGPGWEKEIIVVDNFSSDGTRELLQANYHHGQRSPSKPVRVIYHPRNMGKGASLQTGIAAATGDYFVIFDADLEYEANDIPRMAAKIIPESTVAVFGSRTLGGRRIYEYAKNYWGVRFLSEVANLLYGGQLTDIAVGLKLVHLDVTRSLNLSGTGFELDFELPCKLLKHGYEIKEIPTAYHPRTIEEGKKINAFRDGFRALWIILRTRIRD
jgi:glycosyltransferase involved in cell wall biosynthesis